MFPKLMISLSLRLCGFYSINALPHEGHFGAIFSMAYSNVSFILKHFLPPSLHK